MQRMTRPLLPFIVIGVLAVGVYLLYPYLLWQLTEWQRTFNLALSDTLRHIQTHPQAGFSLVGISFLYGVFHAVGPGHGKVILTSYFSFEQTKLPQAMKVTLLSALVQGIVAIVIVTVLVALLTLSRQYVNLTVKRIEQVSFVVLMLFGMYWIYQAIRAYSSVSKRFNVRKILPIPASSRPLVVCAAIPNRGHAADCCCGHKHLPSSHELSRATDWRAGVMLILSIGLRPCSGAILVLFLAYTLDLYIWGVVSALAMAFGTGLSLVLFALLVLFARQRALRVGQWYLSNKQSHAFGIGLKCLAGVVVLLFGILLFHGSLLENQPTLLFLR